jgi:hypothetical protein
MYNPVTTTHVRPCMVYGQGHIQQYFSYVMVMSFIGGGNRRKSPVCRKSLTHFIT